MESKLRLADFSRPDCLVSEAFCLTWNLNEMWDSLAVKRVLEAFCLTWNLNGSPGSPLVLDVVCLTWNLNNIVARNNTDIVWRHSV